MYKYYAFISYKRGETDEKIANWIHQKLEKYPYPTNLVAEENRPDDREFIRRVFLDTKELPVNDINFTEDIKTAIKKSRYLLLICSFNSVKSQYVNKEVEYFLETHDNDTSKILPIFIDSVECGLPKCISDLDLLNRNCPIYNTSLEAINEINLYCFYHIVSFLLKVDFNLLYNRYHVYKNKKDKQKRRGRTIFNIIIFALILILSFYVYVQSELIEKKNHIVKLEKEIFPFSVVTGYVGNFLEPVVDYIKINEPNAHVYIHMPTKSSDIDNSHRDRYYFISKYIEKELSVDSIRFVTLKTRMPRGSSVHKIYAKNNRELDAKYIDFASTTSTFMSIANKKLENPAYKDGNIDEMINEYSNIFINQANELLGQDSVYVTFVKDLSEINKAIGD